MTGYRIRSVEGTDLGETEDTDRGWDPGDWSVRPLVAREGWLDTGSPRDFRRDEFVTGEQEARVRRGAVRILV